MSKIKSNRNASDSSFGWQFQVSSAIRIMLDNLHQYKKLNIEGEYEDIEITTKKGEKLYIQAKSKVKPYFDQINGNKQSYNSSLSEKMKSAIVGLEKSSQNQNCTKVMYLTNVPYPFGLNCEDKWNDNDLRMYEELRPKERQFVNRILEKNNIQKDICEKLYFKVLYFEKVEDVDTCHRKLLDSIEVFLRNIDINTTYRKEYFNTIMTLCHYDTIDKRFEKSNEDFVAVALMVRANFNSVSFRDLYPDLDTHQIVARIESKYKDVITKYTASMNVAFEILTKYNKFRTEAPSLSQKIRLFVQTEPNLLRDLLPQDMEEKEKEALRHYIILDVISNHYAFDKAKAQYLD